MAKKVFDYQQVAKGFLGTMKDWVDILAERNKLTLDMYGNEQKAKQNFMYKVMEKNYQTPMQKEMMTTYRNQQNQENGGFDVESPQVRIGSGGQPVMNYPSAVDKQFKIKQVWGSIKAKQKQGMPLNDLETKFTQKYPEDVWGDKKALPEGYQESLQNAVKAIEEGKDAWGVYQKMSVAFPGQSSDLKRILVPSSKLGELDISDILWGNK